MADHHHYHGSYESWPDEIAKPFGILLLVTAISLIAYNYLIYLQKWHSFGAPYNYIAAFYYYTLTVPLMFSKYIWHYVTEVGFTQYPNANYVLGILAEIVYIIIIGIIIYSISLAYNKITHKPKRKAILYFFLPALCALIWFILSGVISWLLAT